MKANINSLKETFTERVDTLEKDNIGNKREIEKISQNFSELTDQLLVRNLNTEVLDIKSQGGKRKRNEPKKRKSEDDDFEIKKCNHFLILKEYKCFRSISKAKEIIFMNLLCIIP